MEEKISKRQEEMRKELEEVNKRVEALKRTRSITTGFKSSRVLGGSKSPISNNRISKFQATRRMT